MIILDNRCHAISIMLYIGKIPPVLRQQSDMDETAAESLMQSNVLHFSRTEEPSCFPHSSCIQFVNWKGLTLTVTSTLRLLAAKSSVQNRDKWLPFYIHSLDTAEIMCFLCEDYLSDSVRSAITEWEDTEELFSLCRFIAMVHDVGKLTTVFQCKIGNSIPDYLERLHVSGIAIANSLNTKYPHARQGETILRSLNVPEGIAAVVGSHHGKPQDSSFDWERELDTVSVAVSYYGTQPQLWKAFWEEWLHFSLEQCGYTTVEELPQLGMESQMLLTGLLIMADWIASNEDYFPLLDLDDTGEEAKRQLTAQAAIEKLNLPHCWTVPDSEHCFDFEDRFGFKPNIMQSALIDTVHNSSYPGICILEAEMGGGKTEAALAGAEILAGKFQLSGLFFGLPTQATSNGIFSRLLPWAERQAEDSFALYGMKLAHGSAELNEAYQSLLEGSAQIDAEDDMGLVVHQWFNGSKRSLLSTFVVGTVDQLLMASLKQKHLMLRHLGLAGKAVIIDECHAYDAYMSQYLNRTLSWLGAYRTPVIILSATLPAPRRATLIDAYLNRSSYGGADESWRESRSYPLLTWTDGTEVHQKAIPTQKEDKTVQIESVMDGDLADYLKDNLRQGGCAGVIVNTVRKAQEITQSLQALLGEEFEIQLFHSQFLMPDRAEREAQLMKRVGKYSGREQRNRLIVIGTQVLEQSLDLDFDLMVSQLCPMDLLLQRMGRLHRHSKHNAERPPALKQPRFALLQTEDGQPDKGSRIIYGDWLLLRTKQRLPEKVSLPCDISELVQDVYEEPGTSELSEELLVAWLEAQRGIETKKENAEIYCIKSPRRKSATVRKHKHRLRTNSINGFLDIDAGSSESAAEASVRDGDSSIDVLVMVQHGNGTLHFLPWQYHGMPVSVQEIPDTTLQQKLLRQKLRLPRYFCTPYIISDTIKELEKMTEAVALWQASPLLRGELFLLLDENLSAVLCGRCLVYQQETGLFYENKEEE